MTTIFKKKLLFTGIAALILIAALIIIKVNKHYKTIHSAELLEEFLNQGSQIIIGENDAPHTLFMFYDYDCKVCRYFFATEYKSIKKEFIDTNQLNLILKPISLNNDDETEEAYCFLNCLSHMGLFNELHEVLLIDHNYVYTKEFSEFKNTLINENQELAQCVTTSASDAIAINKKQWEKLNLSAVPIFILGNRVYKGRIHIQTIRDYIK